jgi:hypothetical protein
VPTAADPSPDPSVPDPLATPARIAFAGDWHANTRWALGAVDHAARQGATVIVHVGDFGYDYEASFVRRLDRALTSAGIQLLFVDGNHENFPVLLRYPVRSHGLRQVAGSIWHLPRGFRWTWGTTTLLALGGAHSVDRPWREPGRSWWSGETITDTDIAVAVSGGPVDVLISHDCPAGVDIPGLEETAHLWPADQIAAAEAHRRRLRTVVDEVRPRAIWHGHFHRRYTAKADLGYGPVVVQGLDCDGTTMARNVVVADLAQLSTVDVHAA